MGEISVCCRNCENIFNEEFADLEIDLIESLGLDICQECEELEFSYLEE